jgi:hypothetical protein
MRGKEVASLVRSASFRTEVKDVLAMFGRPPAPYSGTEDASLSGRSRKRLHAAPVPRANWLGIRGRGSEGRPWPQVLPIDPGQPEQAFCKIPGLDL